MKLLVIEVDSILGQSQELIAIFSNPPVQSLQAFQSSPGRGTDQRLTKYLLNR